MNTEDYSIIMPGRIVEYFPETQTATVKISNDRTFSTVEETDQQVVRELLYDVPVFTPGGGFWHLTFPIKTDDPCLINFSQFGYDHWLFDNEDAAGIRDDGQPQPWTARRFSLDDGFAQVGWNNIPTKIAGYHPTDAEFRNVDREQRVALKEDGHVHIKTGTTTIDLAPSGHITMHTDTNMDIDVGGDFTANISGNMTANVTGDSTTSCTNSTVTATAAASVIAPAGINLTAPVTTVSGILLVGGAIGAGGSPAPASGAVISGPIESTDVVTATNVISGGKSLNGHTHTNPEGGNTGGF
jgi:hypothetical protein